MQWLCESSGFARTVSSLTPPSSYLCRILLLRRWHRSSNKELTCSWGFLHEYPCVMLADRQTRPVRKVAMKHQNSKSSRGNFSCTDSSFAAELSAAARHYFEELAKEARLFRLCVCAAYDDSGTSNTKGNRNRLNTTVQYPEEQCGC